LFYLFTTLIEIRVAKLSTTVKADTGILEYAVQTYRKFFEEIEDVANILFSITLELIPVQLISQSIARGGNATGLTPSDGPLVVVLFYVSYDNQADDEKVIGVAKQALQVIEEEARNRGVYHPWLYLNYAFPHQDPIGSYGVESQVQLQKVGKKYDPEGFFQTAGAGLFKLNK
jgi:hypothetical protein